MLHSRNAAGWKIGTDGMSTSNPPHVISFICYIHTACSTHVQFGVDVFGVDPDGLPSRAAECDTGVQDAPPFQATKLQPLRCETKYASGSQSERLLLRDPYKLIIANISNAHSWWRNIMDPPLHFCNFTMIHTVRTPWNCSASK